MNEILTLSHGEEQTLFDAAGIPMIHVRLNQTTAFLSGEDVPQGDEAGNAKKYTIMRTNPAARRFFDGGGDNRLDTFIASVFFGPPGENLIGRLVKLSEGSETLTMEMTLDGNGGEPELVKVVFFPFSVAVGEFHFLLCLTVDMASGIWNAKSSIPFDYLVQFPLPVLVADLSGKIVQSSARAEELFGYTGEELAGSALEMLYHPLVKEEQTALVRKRLRAIGSYSGSIRCASKDGRELIIEVSARLIRRKAGEAFARVEVYRDDTERIRVERELIESEKRYRGLIESQSDMIVRFDSNGLFTFANDAYCLKFGKSRKHLIGKPFMHLVHEDDLPSTIQALRNMEKPPYRASIEQRALTVEGWRWIAWENYSIKDEAGKTAEIQGVGRDITGYKQMQADLLREIDLIKLISSVSSSFISLEPAGVDEGIERALERIGKFTGFDRVNVYVASGGGFLNRYGWKVEEVDSLKDKLREMDANAYSWLMERLRRFESIHIPIVDELPPEAKTERETLQQLSIRSLFAAPMIYNQELRGFLSLVSVREEKTWREEDVALLSTLADIFINALERRRAETELEQSKRNLQRSERLAATGRLAASIAHEINNPLQAITANIGFLGKTMPNEPERQKVLDQIKVGILRIRNTVRQLLDIHRSKSEVTGQVQVNEIIDSTLNLVENQLMINKIQVRKKLAKELPTVRGLTQELFQVFMNIILNAMDAMPRGGTLSIQTAPVARGVRIVFKDTGQGISETDLEHIFDPFFTTKSKMLGTGLGLSIVRGIVESYGGEILVKSTEGRGASFILIFPVS
ncbi:MAG: PAS domain-containing sensor histidine kinase [Candidatus Latescibacterota bacterium]